MVGVRRTIYLQKSTGTLAEIDQWRSFSSPAEFVALAFNNRGRRPEENLSSESTGTLAEIDQWRPFSTPTDFFKIEPKHV